MTSNKSNICSLIESDLRVLPKSAFAIHPGIICLPRKSFWEAIWAATNTDDVISHCCPTLASQCCLFVFVFLLFFSYQVKSNLLSIKYLSCRGFNSGCCSAVQSERPIKRTSKSPFSKNFCDKKADLLQRSIKRKERKKCCIVFVTLDALCTICCRSPITCIFLLEKLTSADCPHFPFHPRAYKSSFISLKDILTNRLQPEQGFKDS